MRMTTSSGMHLTSTRTTPPKIPATGGAATGGLFAMTPAQLSLIQMKKVTSTGFVRPAKATVIVPTDRVRAYKVWWSLRAGPAAHRAWSSPLRADAALYRKFLAACKRARAMRGAGTVVVPTSLSWPLTAYWRKYDVDGYAAWDQRVIGGSGLTIEVPGQGHRIRRAPQTVLTHVQRLVGAYGARDALSVEPSQDEWGVIFGAKLKLEADAIEDDVEEGEPWRPQTFDPPVWDQEPEEEIVIVEEPGIEELGLFRSRNLLIAGGIGLGLGLWWWLRKR